jgi:hypothetical protein
MIPPDARSRAADVVVPYRFPSLPLLSLTLLTVALGACGRVPGQFEIVNNQVPTGSCEIPVNETVYQGQGRLDAKLVRIGSESAFYVFPLLRNNLPGSTSGSSDPNQIALTSFAVDISVLTGPPSTTALIASLEADGATAPLLHYKTPWSGSIPSGGGKVSAWVAAFPVELAARILGAQELGLSPSLWMNLRIRSFGRTNTQDVESDPFDYPVAVCAGCLIANTQPCPYTAPPLNTGNPCNVAQDAFVDCCTSGSELLCPPPVVQ